MPEGTEQVTQAEQTTDSAVQQTAEKVEEAAQATTQAAQTAPTAGIEDVLKGVTDVLKDVKAELQRSNEIATKATKESVKPAAAAAATSVEVTKPKEEVRYVRRHGRKVARKG